MRILLKIMLTLYGMIYYDYSSLLGQDVEAYVGINRNSFYDNIHNDSFYGSVYTSKYGYCFGVGVDNIKLNRIRLRFGLNFDKYCGYLNCNDVALGGGTYTKASVENSELSFSFYPVNIHVLHNIDLNLGIAASTLLDERFSGIKSAWLYKQYNWTHDLQDEYTHFSKKFNVGAIGRIAYDINLTKTLIMMPQYNFYYGFSKEFQHFPKETKSYRHYLCLGMRKILN